MIKDFNGKIAFITGGASGIGLGLAAAFATKGMTVVIADIQQDAIDPAIALVQAAGGTALGVQVDVTDRAAMRAAAAQVTSELGPVHLLCNNAGVGHGGHLQDARDEDWDWVLSVNLGGVVNGLQAFLPGMVAHGEEAHVVNTASVAGLHAQPSLGIYNASKYAVLGLTETLRDDLAGTAVGATALCPGYTATNILGSRRNRQSQFGAWEKPVSGIDNLRRDAGGVLKGKDPLDVAAEVVKAVEQDQLYVITGPEFWPVIRRRFEEISRTMEGAQADPFHSPYTSER